MDKGAMDCINVGIEIFPFNPPPPPPKTAIPDKLLAILKKYKYNWRLKELSKPIRITHKYVSEKEAKPLRYDKPKEIKLEDHTMFYSDQLATPALK